MKHKNNNIVALTLMALLTVGGTGMAQQHTFQSVLSSNTWHRMSVAHEGIYKLDYATLAAMDIDMGSLNPNEIRIFGNPSGDLAEKNSDWRPDDLTEMAIYVSGASDGVFDAQDYVLFYGQEPTRWKFVPNSTKVYKRERNYYTDTTYYYLCVDSGTQGLRIGQKASQPLDNVSAVITEFPDFAWHEEELFSPYNMGRNWFGESLSIYDSLLQIQFVLPGLVKDKPVYIKSEVLGRVTVQNNSLRYDLWANDNVLVSNGSIPYTGGVYSFGKVSVTDKMILSVSDTINMQLKLFPDEIGSTLYLDYVEMFYWRELKRVGSFFPFRIGPMQLGSGNSAVWVQNVGTDFQLWDVSDPLCPVVQQGSLSAGNFVFATDEHSERRYALFRLAAARPIDAWKPIPNQNLHAIATADMLVITHPLFSGHAQALADFHLEEDGMESVVVNVEEIFNEFSTGIHDPSAIRDFIRMVYSRSGGRLKYVTLFGRPSFDARNLNGYNNNFVPCYEDRTSSQDMMSMGTDDYFGLMDNEEGDNCKGRMDLGIGRIPVSTHAEADGVLRKIRQYNDLASNHGEWKLYHLLLADDEQASYVRANEDYCNIQDTVCPELNQIKLYTGAYPHVTTNSGVTVPQANQDLMATLNQGVLMMSYSGHGGVKGLTGKNVFMVSDIVALKNAEKMPFVFTGTCEFSKYDDPLLLSAGEQMFLLPDNGAIAMLTTTRPTYGGNNTKIGKALMDLVGRRDADGFGLRFGDLYRSAKSSDISGFNHGVSININYVLFGDPALRLALPKEKAVTLKVNGRDPACEEIAIHALSMVWLEGEIRDANGFADPLFNGELLVTFFDKKTSVTVSNNESTQVVSYHKDKLYQGRCSVNAGKFSVSFQVPADINPDNGMARFSFYAYDSIRRVDAMGMFDNIELGGIDPSIQPDNEGPQISFYWNTPAFQNGDMVERNGVLYADLYDAQGIYHYDFSLGRDIVLNSNLMAYNNLVLNSHYEPHLDDFRRGRVSIPVNGLSEGTYEFDLKVWDMQNNSSTAHLWVTVGADVFLAGVRNYPNPFKEETRITMTHIGNEGTFQVHFEVFDLMGRNVARHNERLVSAGEGQLGPLVWDGRDQWGNPLPTGVYLYRLTVTDEDGFSRTVSQRMMIAR